MTIFIIKNLDPRRIDPQFTGNRMGLDFCNGQASTSSLDDAESFIGRFGGRIYLPDGQELKLKPRGV